MTILVIGLLFSQSILAKNYPVNKNITASTAFGCQGLIVEVHGRVNQHALTRASRPAHLQSNGNCYVKGNSYVAGDVYAGPGNSVTVDPSAIVTGVTGTQEEACNCNPVSLSSVIGDLTVSNDNDLIPLTEKGRDPLDEEGNLVVRGNDTLILPAGDYLFTSMKINGSSTLAVDGRVFLMVDGPVEIDGTSSLNPDGNPYYLIIYTTTDKVVMGGDIDASATFYIPEGTFTLFGGAELDTGGIFALEVTITGNSIVNDFTDAEAPLITFLDPTDANRISQETAPDIQILLSDDMELNMSSFAFSINGTPIPDILVFSTCPSPPPPVLTCTVVWDDMPPLGPDGNYIFETSVSDLAGNVATASITYELDTTPPEITITEFPNIGGIYTPPYVPEIVVYDEHDYDMTALLNGQPFNSGTPLLKAGTYFLEVEAIDVAGNIGQTLAHGALQAEVLFTVTEPEQNSKVNEINPLFAGTFQTYLQHDGYPALVSLQLNGKPVILEWLTRQSGRWMTKNIFLQQGLNEVCISFVDFWGNSMGDVVQSCITIDYAPEVDPDQLPAVLQLKLPTLENVENDYYSPTFFNVETTALITRSFCIDYDRADLEGKPNCDEELDFQRGQHSFSHILTTPGLWYPTAYIFHEGRQHFSTNIVQIYRNSHSVRDFCIRIYEPFKRALSKDQHKLALLHLHPDIREHYDQLFTAMKENGTPVDPTIWPSCNTEDDRIFFDNHSVILYLNETDTEIVFSRDVLGHWRIAGL